MSPGSRQGVSWAECLAGGPGQAGFLGLFGCWKNVVPCGCRTEIPFSR